MSSCAPGGATAVAGCLWAQPADAEHFWMDVQEDYRAVGFEGGVPPITNQADMIMWDRGSYAAVAKPALACLVVSSATHAPSARNSLTCAI